ncbi:MAG TPA: PorP/SprF family type IX secretion system membrane protein [Chitinophagaceae bacterium]|mgnify:CR=1 FL=1|nr:PorP/SprF family type IX secretion system membrane protein [Chitinophagaceae bacterium]HMU57559.1 PorP/SprF family type IX secretion system membrane protein [Chitinophagaceae bacterium]
MKFRNKIALIFVLLVTLNLKVTAQDVHFSQFFETPLWRNPSLAGIFKGDIRVQAVYRDQWNSVTNAYRTGSVNAEFKMPVGKMDDFITTGVQVLYDRAGTVGFTSSHLLPAINYHKSLSSEKNRYLSLGFMGGVVQRRLDLSKVTTNSQYDNGGLGENFASTQYNYLDGSVGMSYNSGIGNNTNNNFFLGAAYHHFTRPKTTFYRNANIELHPKWVFSGGVRFGVSEYAYMTIQADHSMQGGFAETVAGGMYGLKLGSDPDNPQYTIHAGGFLRWDDAFIPVLKLDYTPFSLAFSYDVNISKLKQSSFGRGGFEVSVSYSGFRNKTADYLLCPKF